MVSLLALKWYIISSLKHQEVLYFFFVSFLTKKIMVLYGDKNLPEGAIQYILNVEERYLVSLHMVLC